MGVVCEEIAILADTSGVVHLEMILLVTFFTDIFRLTAIAAIHASPTGEIVLCIESGNTSGASIDIIETFITRRCALFAGIILRIVDMLHIST